MAEDRVCETKSAHQLAFDHYLRTGQRLTTAEWTARQERKFNPYHDEIGRFTSPPGVTVSWGSPTRSSGLRVDPERQARSITARSVARPRKLPRSRPKPAVSASSEPKENADRYQSELVRTATSEAGNAESYFDLSLRQAGLDGLRVAAGSNPSAVVRADLDEFQRRLDSDRVVLDRRMAVADRETGEIFRAGLAPVDILSGGVNIALGQGEMRDYFSVAGAIPIAGVIRRVGGVVQLGGSRSLVTSMVKDLKLIGFDRHHPLSTKAMELGGLILPPGKAPITVISREHHMQTASWGSSGDANLYRTFQASLIERRELVKAATIDAKNLEEISGGAYSYASEDTIRYIYEIEKNIKR